MMISQTALVCFYALWTFIGLPESARACKFSPSCVEAQGNENQLQAAVERQDTEAVCSILPSKIHCLQVAVDACKDEEPIKRSRDGHNIQLTIKLVEKMQHRFEQMCPNYNVPRNNSAARGPSYYHCMIPAFLSAALALLTTGTAQWVALGLSLVGRAS